MPLSKIQMSSSTGRRNLVINGAMQVAQRATSASGKTSSGYYVCDRWLFANTSQGTWTISQSTTTPSGFANSLKVCEKIIKGNLIDKIKKNII